MMSCQKQVLHGSFCNCSSSTLLIRFFLKNLKLVIKIKINYFGYQATVVTYKYGNFFHCNTKFVFVIFPLLFLKQSLV